MTAATDAALLRQNVQRLDQFMNGPVDGSVALRDVEINTLLGLIGSVASETAPPVTWPGRHWYDTSDPDNPVMNVRSADDSEWLVLDVVTKAAVSARLAAEAARDAAIAAAEASGPVLFYDTKADADAALAGLAEDQLVEVMVDESRLDQRTRYRVETGALVFKVVLGPGSTVVEGVAYGVKADGGDDTAAVLLALDAAGAEGWVRLPPGTVGVQPMVADNISLDGAGDGETTLLLLATGTETMCTAPLIRLRNLTQDDGGRPAMDHTGNPAVYLNECTKRFEHPGVKFRTDRSVVSFIGDIEDAAAVWRTGPHQVERVNEPVPGEEDEMNIFTVLDVRTVEIGGGRCRGLRGRNVYNASFNQDTGSTRYSPMAALRDTEFDVFGKSDATGECKVTFFQGYQTTIEHVRFKDCFGRWIDIIGNDDPVLFTTRGNLYPSKIDIISGDFSAAQAGHPGAADDEPGAIYIRYPGGIEITNYHLDFTGLSGKGPSNNYSGVALRHVNSTRQVRIGAGAIIAPFAHAITVDISDSALTEAFEPNVLIQGPSIYAAANSSRKPVSIANDSATKLFGNVVIEHVLCDYISEIFIDVDKGVLARTATSVARFMHVLGNRETTSGALDRVDFQQFPQRLYAPNTDVSVLYGGSNGAGIISDLEDMLALVNTYRVRKLTLGLDVSQTGVRTAAGPLPLVCQPVTEIVVNGSNGVGGSLEISADGVHQSVISFTLKGNDIALNNVKIKAVDSGGGNTASLLVIAGPGHVLVDTPDWDDAEFGLDTRGTAFTITRGTIHNISNHVINYASKRHVTGLIEGATGTGNGGLVNFVTTVGHVPGRLVRGPLLDVGTTTKTGVGIVDVAA